MEFPASFNTFTIPTGAQPGTSRIFISNDGKLISYGNPPQTAAPVFAALWNGGIYFGPQDDDFQYQADFLNAGQLGLIFVNGVAATLLQSPNESENVANAAQMVMIQAPDDASPASIFFTAQFDNVTNVGVSGAMIKEDPAYTFEEWQDPTASTGWSNGTFLYRQDAQDNVQVTGRLDYTGANVTGSGGSTAFGAAQFPARYRPKGNDQMVTCVRTTSSGVMKNVSGTAIFRTTGVVTIEWGDGMAGTTHDANGLATGDRFFFNVFYPLGNID